jgi:hypothetical protein
MGASAVSGGPWERYATPAPAPAAEGPWSRYGASPPVEQSAAQDVGKSAVSGAVKGVTGFLGLPGTVGGLLEQGGGALGERVGNLVMRGEWRGSTPQERATLDAKINQGMPQGLRERIGSPTDYVSGEGLQRAVEAVTGPLYKPQTTAGEFAGTISEFGTGAIAGGARTAANVLKYGALPGFASEAAGQATKGTAFEAPARIAAGVGVGLGAALLSRPGSAAQVIQQAVGGPVDDATVARMTALMDDAARQGVQLTPIEALRQVTDGGFRRLGTTQRLVENSEGGAPIMDAFMAQRPGQVANAARQQFDAISPNAPNPITTGVAVRNAAQGAISDTQGAINAATRPAYQAAEAVRVPQQQFQQLTADPLFARTLAAIRSDPALNRTIAGLPDDAVGTIDLVIRRMDELARNARVPGQASTSNLVAKNLDDASAPALQVAEAAAPSYAQANAAQRQLRGQYLEPLNEGPVGRLSQTTDVAQQGRAILPNQPQAGQADVSRQAVQQLVRKDANAARDLVRSHAESTFNEAIQNNIPGANQFGGAKFASTIAGNPEQRATLQAAVEALPGGKTTWQGFNNFLEVMEATGKRLPIGSETAFNATATEQLARGGVKQAIGGPVRFIQEKFQQWQLGNNTAELARLLTDPRAAGLFGRIIREPVDSAAARNLTARLIQLGERGLSTTTEAGKPLKN